MSVCDPSCRSALDFLNGADLIYSVGIPHCGCILKNRSNKGFVRCFLCFLVTNLEVAREEAKCLVGFVGNGVDMGASCHVVLDVDTKVLCGGDVFSGMSMQLIFRLFFHPLTVTFSAVHFGGDESS